MGHVKEEGALGAVGAFGGLLGLPELRSAAHIVIDAAGHGDGVHVAGDVFHQDIPGLHPMNLTIIAGLAHLHMEQALAPPVGVQLGIAVHDGIQPVEVLRIGHGGLQGVHHLLHGEALEQALVDDAVVIDGESLVFRQVLLQNEGVHGAGGGDDQVHAGTGADALVSQLRDVADAGQQAGLAGIAAVQNELAGARRR